MEVKGVDSDRVMDTWVRAIEVLPLVVSVLSLLAASGTK